ncbi:MAG: hypothetical protein H7327_11715 [Herminiimonas sp.]|nr:hypothetical protein [Herminiimonas sp.]
MQGKGIARVVATGERTALWWIVAGGLLMLGLALFVPFMNALFHFQTPPLDHLALTLAITTAILTLMASPRSAPGQTVGHR